MHLYFITRGIKWAVDDFINQLRGKYFPFTWKSPDGTKTENQAVQCGVRPIQMWEVVYPKEFHEHMKCSVFKEGKGATQHKKHNKFVALLRTMLGVKKIDDYEYDIRKDMILSKPHVEAIGIGQKEDRMEDGVEML